MLTALHYIRTGSAPADVALARQPDGGSWSATGSGSLRWVPTTRGAANGDPPAASASASGGLVASLAAAPAAGGVASCSAATHQPLRIGSWNIQNYGNAKSGRGAVMDAIGGIAARYAPARLTYLRAQLYSRSLD